MKKVKTINNFRTVKHGYTEEMIPVADAESQRSEERRVGKECT